MISNNKKDDDDDEHGKKIDNQILRLDTRIELGTEHSFNLCESTHGGSQNHKKKKKCHKITHTEKNSKGIKKKNMIETFCLLHPTHRSSYGFLFLFPFVSLILLS